MEVHHHGGHLHMKSKWMEYLFQFFMLFLAVYLGSQAENRREHKQEGKREIEYIRSLFADVKNDTSVIGATIPDILDQTLNIDTLQSAFFSVLKDEPGAVNKCYYFSDFIQFARPINFTERTITQLLSSGNMRLLKTEGVADSIMDYFSFVKTVDVQKQMYVDNINRCMETMYNVYDITYLRKRVDKESISLVVRDPSLQKLLTTDPVEIKKLVATLEITRFIIYNYRNLLIDLYNKADALLNYLQSRYHFKDQ